MQSRVDMLIGIYRIFELAAAWREGIWYPRLGPDLNFTYGAPLFQFYPPLVSYIGLVFYGLGLGLISAAKATFAVSLLAAGTGMYVYARSVFADRCAAWLSAMMYVTAPYLLLDIYERGAAAETLALGILPWLFWAMRRLLERSNRWTFFLSALLLAALMLAHNITTLFVLPALLAYLLLLALWQRRPLALLPVAGATALGLGLCAFYWLPAVLEIRYTHAEEFMLGAGQVVTQSLRPWNDLFQDSFVTAYQGPLRFHFALRPLFFGLLGVVALPFLPRRHRYELGLMILCWGAVLFLQSQGSLWFWLQVPLVRFIQFTWRLYGLASLAVALLIGGIVAVWPLRGGYRWLVAAGLTAVALWTSAARLDPAQIPIWYGIEEEQINLVDLFERGRDGFPIFSDYQPLHMTTIALMMTLFQPQESDRLPAVTPPTNLQVTAENFTRIDLAVDALVPFTLRAPRIYFPGWQIYANGQPVPTGASGQFGLVTAELPAGSYRASIRFEQTPVRRWSDWLSLFALLIVVVGLTVGSQWRRRWPAGLAAALVVLLMVFYVQGPAKRLRTPVATPVNFQDQLHLLGYTVEKPTWRPGETFTLRLYWFTPQSPPVDYKFFLHLTELDDSGKVAQMDTLPMLNFSSTTRWEPGELKFDLFHLPLPPEIRAGRYRVVIGVYPIDAVQNLTVLSGPNVLPGDRVALTEVEILNE